MAFLKHKLRDFEITTPPSLARLRFKILFIKPTHTRYFLFRSSNEIKQKEEKGIVTAGSNIFSFKSELYGKKIPEHQTYLLHFGHLNKFPPG